MTMNETLIKRFSLAGLIFTTIALSGCANMSRQEQNTAIGAGVGAVAGSAIGGTAGAVGGAVVGGVIGHETTKPRR